MDRPELPAPVRQQLVLAQVRLLELTDAREALATQLALAERSLTEAQVLAAASVAERDHLATVNRQVEAHAAQLQAQLDQAGATHQQDQQRIAALESGAVIAAHATAGILKELTALKATRSWRWTAPFRALGKLFSGPS